MSSRFYHLGRSEIRGTDVMSSHGIPRDLLDRLLIIRTLPYSEEEMVQIIRIRATTEGLTIEDDAVTVLGKIGANATLRYAVQVDHALLNKFNHLKTNFIIFSAPHARINKRQDLWANKYYQNRHQGYDRDLHGREEQRDHVEGELCQVHDVSPDYQDCCCEVMSVA